MAQDFTKGSIIKGLLGFSIPIFAAMLLQALYGTVDLLFVGKFSDTASVSAVSTGSMTMQTVSGIITGLTMGCSILLGHNIGRKDDKASARTIGAALWLFIIVGIFLSIILFAAASPIASVMHAPKEAFEQTVGYIKICSIGILFIVLFNAVSGIFRGMGDSKTPLILMGIACIVNILGDYIFAGIFKMGAHGVAIATVTAQGVSVFSAVLLILKNRFPFEVKRNDLRLFPYETKKILQFGLPIAAQDALTGVSFMIILAILNSFGVVASAGVGVAEKICALMFLIPSTFMSAISAFTAQNVGAGTYERAKKAMYCGIIFSVFIGTIVFLSTFFGGHIFAGFFSKDKDVILAAADYLRSFSVDCVLVGFSFCMMGYLNGNGKTLFVSIQGILSTFLIRIPVSYFMSKIEGVSLFQIGFATPLATLFAIILCTYYLIYFEKKEKILI